MFSTGATITECTRKLKEGSLIDKVYVFAVSKTRTWFSEVIPVKIFIAGARNIKTLDDNVKARLMSIYNNKHSVIVGDCYGVDTAVQDFFMKMQYKNVTVFASNGQARNNIGNWNVENVQVDVSLKGFDFYKQKDIAMANNADYGFMIWDGSSRGTLNNIINLIQQNKKVLVYTTIFHRMFVIGTMVQLNFLVEHCPQSTQKTYRNLLSNNQPINDMQLSFIL